MIHKQTSLPGTLWAMGCGSVWRPREGKAMPFNGQARIGTLAFRTLSSAFLAPPCQFSYLPAPIGHSLFVNTFTDWKLETKFLD